MPSSTATTTTAPTTGLGTPSDKDPTISTSTTTLTAHSDTSDTTPASLQLASPTLPPITRPPKKLRVSFSSRPCTPEPQPYILLDESDHPGAASNTNISTMSKATSGKKSPSKSALKPGTESTISAPPKTFTHPDPLLRRLRLRDPYGEEVDLMKEFRDTEIVGFLFGARWSRQDRQFYQDFTNLCKYQPHRFKGVYVSVDAEETAYIKAARNHLWLAMEWNDGSNLPASSHDSLDPTSPLSLHHSESFLLAAEPDLEYAHSISPSTPPSAYLRPYSRVHLAAKWDVLSIPSLVIYDVKNRKVIQDWIAARCIREDRIPKTWDAWTKGQQVGVLNLKEFAQEYWWSLAFCLFAIIYTINVRLFGGENFLGNAALSFHEKFMK